MRILITNDDGINAAGIKVLYDIAKLLSDDVWVVAPETNQSGTSHAMTLHEPLRSRVAGERWIAVNGTPTDCVMMAVRHIMLDEPPALVLSGVNHGSNLAEDVTYSGTIAAAMEGTLLGVPSIALSLMSGVDDDGRGRLAWDTPLAHAPGLITRLIDTGWQKGVVININFPDLPPDDIKGIEFTAQGQRDQALLSIDKRQDPWGTPYFWYGFQRRRSTLVPGTDLAAVADGRISITPLSLNLTDEGTRQSLAKAFGGSARAKRAKTSS